MMSEIVTRSVEKEIDIEKECFCHACASLKCLTFDRWDTVTTQSAQNLLPRFACVHNKFSARFIRKNSPAVRT